MALIVIDEQLLLVLDLFNWKYPKQRYLFFICSVVLIGQVLHQISRKIVDLDINLTKDNVCLVAWRRMVDHMPKSIGIVECSIYFLVWWFTAQSIRDWTFFDWKVSQLENLTTGKVDVLWVAMVLFPLFHRYAFEIVQTGKYLSRYKSKELANRHALFTVRKDEISSSPSSSMLNLTFSNDWLKSQIIS